MNKSSKLRQELIRLDAEYEEGLHEELESMAALKAVQIMNFKTSDLDKIEGAGFSFQGANRLDERRRIIRTFLEKHPACRSTSVEEICWNIRLFKKMKKEAFAKKKRESVEEKKKIEEPNLHADVESESSESDELDKYEYSDFEEKEEPPKEEPPKEQPKKLLKIRKLVVSSSDNEE